MSDEIEKFPIKKTAVRYEKEPEMFFFAPDEEAEEAEFIRVDDLFGLEEEEAPKRDIILTLFPARRFTFIKGAAAQAFKRTIALTALRLERPAQDIRVRPLFVQWRVSLEPGDSPEQIAREIRADLEGQARVLLNINADRCFWSNACFIRPADRDITIAAVVKMIENYQEDL